MVCKVCTKAILLGERSVRIREVKGSNPSRSTNLPHRFVRCGVFYVQKTLADHAGLRTLKSDANRAGASMYFLKIHRFHASFFEFCMVLRASASLLCPLLGDSFKNFRTIVGWHSLELFHLVEAGIQGDRDSSEVFVYRVCCGRASFCTVFCPHQRYFRMVGTRIFRLINFAILFML